MNEPATTTATPSKDDLWREFDHCARLERELVKNRWMFFTAMLTVSFAVCGLVLNQFQALGPLLGKAGFFLGWLVFIAGYYHYWWFHRKAHDLRDHLCDVENKLQILVYRIRTRRPRFLTVRIYYHWVIDILALAYIVMLILVLTR